MYEGIKLAIIGCGRWGINHIRTAAELLGNGLKAVCDISPAVPAKLKKLNLNISFIKNYRDILEDPDINSVVIATPVPSHYSLAREALLAGKNVLVEKPMALISEHASDLTRIAERKKLVLMVGHILLFHPAINEIKNQLRHGKLGKLQYIYSNRLNLGTIRTEENILWSFAPHDISILQFLIEKLPIYVGAKGADLIQDGIEDTTLTYLIYPDNIHAHIFVSWLHPFKEHRLVVIGDAGMIVFDDTANTDKLKFFKKGFLQKNGTLEKFDTHFEILNYPSEQPLVEEHKHFYNCILNGEHPLTDGNHAREVLEILEIAQSKLHKYN
ncbi:MAG: Gfo/Idh/MocA family protein [Ignavibacteria bacterium]